MYECKRIAVIQRGKSGNCFRRKFARGKALGVAKPAYFPLALPLSGHAFLERTLWCV